MAINLLNDMLCHFDGIDWNKFQADGGNMKSKQVVGLLLADITVVAVDAMVNPANESLLPGSGLCGVIHKKGGEELNAACKELFNQQRTRPVGSAVATTAGALPARHVIHVVGPKWHEHQSDPSTPLRDTWRNILHCADSLRIQTLSVPAISTGMHKYPKELAAQVALETLADGLSRCSFVRRVLLVSSDVETASAYREAAGRLGLTSFEWVDLMPGVLSKN